MEWWQFLPMRFDPIVFSIGFFSLRWYALLWLIGLGGASFVFVRYAKRRNLFETRGDTYDFLLTVFFGTLIGGRLGYVILYQPEYFLAHPAQLVWPFDENGAWSGIAGMSFYGGLLGGLVALSIIKRYRDRFFWHRADALALSVPVALFFGRLGNFLNQELIGRVTAWPWGMYFSGQTVLRHPSPLYEAVGEGVLLFVMLFFLQKRTRVPGSLSACFLILYGVMRFILEWFREPDRGASLWMGVLTAGQLYSFVIIGCGSMLWWWFHQKNRDIIVG